LRTAPRSCRHAFDGVGERVHLFSVVSALSHQLLPDFLRHYKSLGVPLGTNARIVLHVSRSCTESDVHAAEESLARGGLPPSAWEKVTDAVFARSFDGGGPKALMLNRFITALPAGHFVIFADVDEHYVYPCEVAAWMDDPSSRLRVQCGVMRDRAAADYRLSAVDPSQPLSEQYSLCADIRMRLHEFDEALPRVNMVKVTLVRADLKPHWHNPHEIAASFADRHANAGSMPLQRCNATLAFSHYCFTDETPRLLMQKMGTLHPASTSKAVAVTASVNPTNSGAASASRAAVPAHGAASPSRGAASPGRGLSGIESWQTSFYKRTQLDFLKQERNGTWSFNLHGRQRLLATREACPEQLAANVRVLSQKEPTHGDGGGGASALAPHEPMHSGGGSGRTAHDNSTPTHAPPAAPPPEARKKRTAHDNSTPTHAAPAAPPPEARKKRTAHDNSTPTHAAPAAPPPPRHEARKKRTAHDNITATHVAAAPPPPRHEPRKRGRARSSAEERAWCTPTKSSSSSRATSTSSNSSASNGSAFEGTSGKVCLLTMADSNARRMYAAYSSRWIATRGGSARASRWSTHRTARGGRCRRGT